LFVCAWLGAEGRERWMFVWAMHLYEVRLPDDPTSRYEF